MGKITIFRRHSTDGALFVQSRCVRYVLGNTLVMSNWERVSESDYADDGGLIDIRKCAFAPTIGPNKDGHTHMR